jgi:hypothetical protein
MEAPFSRKEHLQRYFWQAQGVLSRRIHTTTQMDSFTGRSQRKKRRRDLLMRPSNCPQVYLSRRDQALTILKQGFDVPMHFSSPSLSDKAFLAATVRNKTLQIFLLA